MASKELPSAQTLRKLLSYDPETGFLFWRERTPDMFSASKISNEAACANWNGRLANRRAFSATDYKGYHIGSVNNQKMTAHRVIWAIYYGSWPSKSIDHINGDVSDNRIENLRQVVAQDNNRNKRRAKNNSSGHTGVCWSRAADKWAASITSRGKQYHLGVFDSLREAKKRRKEEEKRFGFHENHGR